MILVAFLEYKAVILEYRKVILTFDGETSNINKHFSRFLCLKHECKAQKDVGIVNYYSFLAKFMILAAILNYREAILDFYGC